MSCFAKLLISHSFWLIENLYFKACLLIPQIWRIPVVWCRFAIHLYSAELSWKVTVNVGHTSSVPITCTKWMVASSVNFLMLMGCVWCISSYSVELLQCNQREDNSKIKVWLQDSFKCNTVQTEAFPVEDIKVLCKLFSVSEGIPERPKKLEVVFFLSL